MKKWASLFAKKGTFLIAIFRTLLFTIYTKISQLVSIPEKEVLLIINGAQDAYKRYTIKKKNGGKRVIFQPSKATKKIQYSIINLKPSP